MNIGRNGLLIALTTSLGLGACSIFRDTNDGAGARVQRQLLAQASADTQPAPDNAGVYLDLISRMQAQGLYFASLAHIDAYEQQYGATPETVLLRADALRETGQPAAAKVAYGKLLKTPLAADGYHGLGLLAGAAGDFAGANAPLARATQLAPINAMMLSDLAYARMRAGDLAGARVPLLKAAELDRQSRKIMSNLALYMVAIGRTRDAQAFMTREQFAPDVRASVEADAVQVMAAAHPRDPHDETGARAPGAVRGGASVPRSISGSGLPASMLERFAPAAQ